MKTTLTTIDLQALEAGLTKGHRLAAATHAAPETIGQIIERLRGITALIAHIDGHHSEDDLEMVGRWYMVNKDGMATLCIDRADAEKEAVDAQSVWPHMGPHRAVQLIEASFEAADMATAAAQWFRDGVASVAASAGSKPVIGWHAFPHYLQHPDGRHLRTASDLLARHGYTGCAEPLRAMSDVLLPTNPSPPEGMMGGWISLPGALPEPGTPVLLDIGRKYPIRAMWAAKHTVQAADDDTDWGEYVEADDMYYAPEGWYEWNQCEDNHWCATETPRAWMPLPPTSAEGVEHV